MARFGTALARRSDDRPANALGERLADALERRLAHAVERRLGGAAGQRRPGRLEQRVVAALQRRMAARSPRAAGVAAGPLRRAGQALAHHRRATGGLPAESTTTLRALVVGILARTMVRAVVRLLRILSRGLIGGPLRRLAGMVIRRTLRARPGRQAGILALLMAAVLLAYRELMRRLAALPDAQRAAIRLGLRGLRRGLPAGLRLLSRLLRQLTAAGRRRLGRLAAARRAG